MTNGSKPEPPAPNPPTTGPTAQMQVDCAVGLQAMPDGSTLVVMGYNIGGYYMGTLLLPLAAADRVGDELKKAAKAGANPLITGADAVNLLGRIPRK